MFFDDVDLTPRKQAQLKALPPIPETGWRPPQYYPNLSSAAVIGVDTEVKETDFERGGPGWSRGAGHIVGMSISAVARDGTRGKWYFPVRHEVEPEYNLDPVQTFAWAKTVLETPHIPKIGANLLYDIGWLTEENIFTTGDFHDVQFAEALIDNEAEVALEALGAKYLDRGKKTNDLYDWIKIAYGGGDPRKHIWRSPPRLVGPYGEDDAELPLDILSHQFPQLEKDGLVSLYRMECELIPLLIRMRRQGVRIDVNEAEKLYDEIGVDIMRLFVELAHMTGVQIDSVGSPDQLAKVFDAAGIQYPHSPTGKPSFRKEWLAGLENPVADKINEIREHEKIRGTFVKSYLLESNVNGIVHCQFHPLKNDEGGAKTGRFSSSTPNLQNIPIRSKLGKKVRKAFLAHAGHEAWEKIDYSQIEYRMLAHYAVDGNISDFARIQAFWSGQLALWGQDGAADALRQAYVNDPQTDYHKLVQDNIFRLTGKKIDRRPIKNINFGLLYGQSQKSLAYKAGFTQSESVEVFKVYHEGAPYVKPTMKAIGSEVQVMGHISTILGRRVQFNLWEPAAYGERGFPLPYRQALMAYGSMIRRANDYRGVNYKFQGSGTGDVIKMGMWKAFKSGVFDVIGVPLIQVHDELGQSVIDHSAAQNEAYRELHNCLETGIRFRIPIKVDAKRGANWGSIED